MIKAFNNKATNKAMKKNILLVSLLLFALFFGACKPTYVTVRPTQTELARPMSPSNNHIWIDGNWVYNRRMQSYTRTNGYWSMPNRGRTYMQGQWKTSQKGYYWVPGRWK